MIAIASDHGGYEMKKAIKQYLEAHHLEYIDCGTDSADSCSYVDYAKKLCPLVSSGDCEKGILVCGTGIGMSLAANKHRGIRAAVCSDCFSAKYTRLHNDANVLCLGARVIGKGLALEIVEIFLQTAFEGGRHAERIAQVMALEESGV